VHADAIFAAAPSPGVVTGAREAALTTLVLLIMAITVRVARPALRRRHARLVGATPQDALLLAGLGEVVRPPATPVEPVVAITILPAKEPRDRIAHDQERILQDADAALVDLLGVDHPVSAPGRHRAVAGWASALHRVQAIEPDAELLLAPEASADAASAVLLELQSDGQDDMGTPRIGADEQETSAAMAETDLVTPAPPRTMSAAAQRYAIDWGEDLEWADLDAGPHPDGWERGWVAAQGETWKSAETVSALPVARRTPTASPRPAAAAVTPESVADQSVTNAHSTLALWWSTIENSGVAFETAQDVLAQVEGHDSVEECIEHVIDEAPAIEEPASEIKVPAPRHSGAPSVAQRDALAGAQDRLAEGGNRIAIAEIVTAEAKALVHAQHAALIVRSLEGPRVLWLNPAGAEIWGPQTLAALLGSGTALRDVVEGDPLAEAEATALMVVPVASAGAHVGAIIARRPGTRPFTAPEQSLLDRLARMTGATLDALTRRGGLRNEGEHVDPVTGLAPQDRLMHDLRVALRTREEHGMAVSLIVAEVDGLARLRTEQGAEQADQALGLVADTVASALRVGDVPYRLGTDELAILLAATEIEAGEQVATRLADEVGTACAESLQLTRPLRLRTAVVSVVGSAEDVVSQANQALASARIQARWERRLPTQY